MDLHLGGMRVTQSEVAMVQEVSGDVLGAAGHRLG